MIIGKDIDPAYSMVNPVFDPPKKNTEITIYEDGEVEFEVDNIENYTLTYVSLEELKQLVVLVEKYVEERKALKEKTKDYE